MSFDQNLIRVSIIGVVFLIIFGFILHSSYQKIEDRNKDIDADCSDCYLQTKTITQEHHRRIEELLKELKDREV